MNLAHALEFQAMKHGNQTAVIFKDVSYDYCYMNDLANQFAATLHGLGVKKGDRVSLWLPNGLDFIGAFYGTLKLGAMVVVPMNIMFKASEVSHILSNAEVKVLITQTSMYPVIKEGMARFPQLEKVIFIDDQGSRTPFESEKYQFFSFIKKKPLSLFAAINVSPDDGAAILYTSGTTGSPLWNFASPADRKCLWKLGSSLKNVSQPLRFKFMAKPSLHR